MSFSGDLYPTAGADVVMTSSGDMVKYQSGARARLGIGSANQILQVKSSLPSWETVPLADTVLTTQGDILYQGASALARLGQSTDGFVLTTKGASANPVWAVVPTGAETHTFTSEETFTPTTQTGIMQVLIDTNAMSAGGVKTTVDGVIKETITTTTSSIRMYNPSTSITIISQAGGGNAFTESYTYGSSEIPAGDLISCLIGDSGSKMYLASNNLSDNETVYEYDLATPYDVSTASYSSNSFGDPTSANIRGMGWSADGSSWIRDSTAQTRFYQFDCSTAWDISTSSETANYTY